MTTLAAWLVALAPCAAGQAAADEAARVLELLDEVRAHYATASTYRDVGTQRTTLRLDDGDDFTTHEQLVLSFERAPAGAIPVSSRTAPHGFGRLLPHRWQVEHADFGAWGLRDSKATWSDGEVVRIFFGLRMPPMERPVHEHALGRAPEVLPLRWALAEELGLHAPLARYPLRRALGGAVIDGRRCLGLELLEGDEPHSAQLVLWMHPESRTLRRLESRRWIDGGPYVEVIDYAPSFDLALPDGALRFTPPARRFGLTLRAQLDVLSALIVALLACLAARKTWRRRAPKLSISALAMLPFGVYFVLSFVKTGLQVWRAPWPAGPFETVQLVAHASVLLLILAPCVWARRTSWGRRGVSQDALRHAVEAHVRGAGAEPVWTARRRGSREVEHLELPRSEIALELGSWRDQGRLRVCGRGGWAERAVLRRDLEARLDTRTLGASRWDAVWPLGFGIFVLGSTLWTATF